ncbi:MAG: PH domain-containing protein [Actinomycetota bacterium]
MGVPAPTSGFRYLADDEQVVLAVRHHSSMLLCPFLGTIAIVALAAIFGSVASPNDRDGFADQVAGFVALAAVVRFLWATLNWWAERIFVTDQRVFVISGILGRSVASMPLAKMTDMTYLRTVWGRAFGYGHLVLETSGQKQALGTIAFLPQPDQFYRTVTTLVTTRLHPAPLSLYQAGPEEPPPTERGAGSAGPQASRDDEDTGPIPPVRT